MNTFHSNPMNTFIFNIVIFGHFRVNIRFKGDRKCSIISESKYCEQKEVCAKHRIKEFLFFIVLHKARNNSYTRMFSDYYFNIINPLMH